MLFLYFFAEKVAVKILDKTKLDQKTQRLLSREICSMEKLHHPNIIRLYEVVETLAKLHIVMEYASGGELFTKISNEGKMPENEAKPIFAQVVSAVQHMVSDSFILFKPFCIWSTYMVWHLLNMIHQIEKYLKIIWKRIVHPFMLWDLLDFCHLSLWYFWK